MLNKVKKFANSAKGKVLGVMSLGVIGATNAMADVTFDEGTGFGGTFDLSYFYSAVGIIVSAIAIVAAIGLAIRQFRKI